MKIKKTKNGQRKSHCKLISSIGPEVPSIEERLGSQKPACNPFSSDTGCPEYHECTSTPTGPECVYVKECNSKSDCPGEQTCYSGFCEAHMCYGSMDKQYCFCGPFSMKVGLRTKNGPIKFYCKSHGTIIAPSEDERSSSSDSFDTFDGHNGVSKTPVHRNMNSDAVLFSNVFQNSVMQALAIVGVLYVLYVGYRSATRALRSKYKTVPSPAAEEV